MELLSLIAQYGGWSWLVLGFALLALELVVPGGILLWLGVSAVVTALVALLAPATGWPLQFLIFGVLAIGSISAWLRLRPTEEPSDRPFLNRRAERFVGRELVLDEPIRDGQGRVSLGDTLWRVKGPDLAAGSRIRVVSDEGALLKVDSV